MTKETGHWTVVHDGKVAKGVTYRIWALDGQGDTHGIEFSFPVDVSLTEAGLASDPDAHPKTYRFVPIDQVTLERWEPAGAVHSNNG